MNPNQKQFPIGCHRSRQNHGNLYRIIVKVLIGVLFATLFALLFGIAVKFLWGITLCPLFDFPAISYWQAVGIVILSRLVFGCGHGSHHNDHFQRLHDRIHEYRAERTDDERQDVEETASEVPDWEQEQYQEFWEAEGKKAFQEYLTRRQEKAE